MRKMKIVLWAAALLLIPLIAGAVFAAGEEIPFGDYEVLSENETHTEFVLAFTGDYRWQILTECLQTGVTPPAVGSLCNYSGENFTCPGAQSLGFLAILQQPPTPSPTLTFTATATFTPTATSTSTPTATGTATATTTSTARPSLTATPGATAAPSQTPVLPGAPLTKDLQATIQAANAPFERPQGALARRIVEWIHWMIQQVLFFFEK